VQDVVKPNAAADSAMARILPVPTGEWSTARQGFVVASSRLVRGEISLGEVVCGRRISGGGGEIAFESKYALSDRTYRQSL
jgi:hypothetical protein